MASIPKFFIVEQQSPLNSISYAEEVNLLKWALFLLIVY